MCKFLSAIGLKNGDIICDPNVDSHEDLIRSDDIKCRKMMDHYRNMDNEKQI